MCTEGKVLMVYAGFWVGSTFARWFKMVVKQLHSIADLRMPFL